MSHIMFTYKGKFYSRYKDWSLPRIEAVLTRLGATYWEIGAKGDEIFKLIGII